MWYVCVTPFWPMGDGWRGAYVWDQVMALRRAGVEVMVFVPQSGGEKIEGEVAEVPGQERVYRFKTRETPSYLFNGFFNEYNKRSFCKALAAVGVKPSDIAVVHCHTGPMGIYGLAVKDLNRGAVAVVQHHDPDPYTIRNGRLAGWRPNLRYRARNSQRIIEGVDLNLCISGYVEENLLKFPEAASWDLGPDYKARRMKIQGVKCPEGVKSYVLYNGVDLRKFNKGVAKDDNCFTIGCIGNFIDWKDQMTLLRAVASVVASDGGIVWGKQLRVRLIGSGPTLAECQMFVKERGLEDMVSFEHEVKHEMLEKFYQSLDLFVLPSYFEGFGCVFTEAAACGVPFVCCKKQGAAEYIAEEDEGLWCVAPHDDAAIADIIRRQMTSPLEQRLVKPLDIDVLVGDYLAMLQREFGVEMA